MHDQWIISPTGVANQDYGTLQQPTPSFLALFGGEPGDSGVRLTEENVIGHPPVWNAISRIAGHIAQMPLEVLRWTDDAQSESVVDRRHPAYSLLTYEASPGFQAADRFRETMMLHALLRGNGRAFIVRNARQDPIDLMLMPSDRTWTVEIHDKDSGDEFGPRSLWHVMLTDDGKYEAFADRDVFHIAGLGGDGLQGYDLLSVAKNALGIGLVQEKQTARYFKNDARPSLFLTAPAGALRNEADARQFIADFNAQHSGDNKGRAALLREGITANIPNISGQAGQHVEQRTFQRQEVALLMCMESMLGDGSGGGWASLEQRQKDYRSNCLGRWMTRWEREAWRKLLSAQQRKTWSHDFKFDDSLLLQAEFASRMATYSQGIAARVVNPNECRRWEGLPPYEGGDEFVNPNTLKDGQPGQKEPPSQPRQTPPAAVLNRIKHLAGVEANRIADAKNAKNFCQKIDDFLNRWKPTLEKAFAESGLPANAAEDWIADSRDRVLEAAGAPASDFATTLDATLTQWPARAEAIATTLYQGA